MKATRGRPRTEAITGTILAATVALIAEEGVGALTMDAVAARSGVSKPTIYRRWATKQDLVIQAIGTRIAAVSVPDLGGLRAELEWLLNRRLEMYTEPGSDRLIAGLVGAAAEDEAFRAAARRATALLLEETARVVRRGIERGEVREDVDIPTVVTMVASPLIFRSIVELAPLDRSLVAGVVDMVVRACAP